MRNFKEKIFSVYWLENPDWSTWDDNLCDYVFDDSAPQKAKDSYALWKNNNPYLFQRI